MSGRGKGGKVRISVQRMRRVQLAEGVLVVL